MKGNFYYKRGAALVLSIVLSAGMLSGCGKVEEGVMAEDIPVEAQVPQEGELVLSNEFVGKISPQEAVYVIPLVSGEVVKTFVKLGEAVEEGETLCKIDDEAARMQLAGAEASYKTAEASAKQALGSSMDLQYLQMEASRKQMIEQKDEYETKLNDTQKDIKDLKEDEGDVKKAAEEAEGAYSDAAAQFMKMQTLKAKLGPTLSSLNITSNAALKLVIIQHAKAAIPELKDEEGNIIENPTDDQYYKAYLKLPQAASDPYVALQKGLSSAGIRAEDLSDGNLELLKETMELKKSAMTAAGSAKASVANGITSLEGAEDQIESAISQAEDGIDTALKSAEITYGKTVEETKEIVGAQLNAADVGIQSAKMQLDMYTLKAPVSGVVEAANVDVNGFASSGNPAYVITNKESMTVTFYVSEDIRSTLAVGQSIKVERSGKAYAGNITEIAASVDQQSGLFQIKANIEANGNELLSGVTVKVIADTYRENGGLLIPYDAVYYDSGQAYVYCVSDGKAVKTEIVPGIFNDSSISVLSGISIDSQIITSWSPNLHDGAVVSVKEDKETVSSVSE